MSNPNPPSGGENQNWAPQPPPQPQQPYPQMQPQQYAPPQQPYPQPQQPAPAAPPTRPMPQVNMQNVNQMVKSVPQLVRALRLIAWTELIVLVLLGLIGFCGSLTAFGGIYSLGISAFTSLLVTVLEAFVFWGLLMGVALLLENQSSGRTGA